jgi:hypothetical protein
MAAVRAVANFPYLYVTMQHRTSRTSGVTMQITSVASTKMESKPTAGPSLQAGGAYVVPFFAQRTLTRLHNEALADWNTCHQRQTPVSEARIYNPYPGRDEDPRSARTALPFY